MKAVFKIAIFTLAIFFSSNLIAQENIETNNNFLHFYDSELFHWSFSMFNATTLRYSDQSSATIFGLNKTMQNALLLYPESGQAYKAYRWKNITGNVLLWAGLAVTLSAFIPIVDINENISYGVGLTSAIVGAFFYTSGQESIFNAVSIFNRNRINEYR